MKVTLNKIKLVSLILIAFVAGANAQNSALNNAIFAQRDADLDIAKRYIDEAILHEKTINNPKTWYTRALIYEDLYKTTNPKFKPLAENADAIAVEAYLKTVELDAAKKGEYFTNASNKMPVLWSVLLNNGVSMYNAGEYDGAIRTYDLAIRLRPSDTTAYVYSIYATSAAGKNEKTYEIANQLKSIGYTNPRLYLLMIQYARSVKQDTMLVSQLINDGYKEFPTDKGIIVEKLNQLLIQGNVDSAIEELNMAISKFPDDPVLYFNRAVMYEKKKMREEAIADYKKAIEVDPQHFDSNFNLGAFYFNEGVQIRNESNTLNPRTELKKQQQLDAEAKVKFQSCIPYFEKALEIKPADETIKFNLEAAQKYSK